MSTMIVLVQLKDGVDAEEYERWVLRSYAPAVRELGSVSNWSNHRVNSLLGSDDPAPYQYVVTLEVSSMEELARDMFNLEMQRLITELHGYAGVTQLLADRFA